MTIALWCLLAAFILIYVPRVPALKGAIAQEKRYDILEPRAQQARLTGRGLRAQSAHQNMVEAFAPFAVGVLLNHIESVPTDAALRDILALVFIATRLVYIPAYLNDWGYGRSAVWAVGVLAVIGLLTLPAMA